MARPKVQHQQLIVTLYGLYGEATNGRLRVSTLVALLAHLGIDGQAARSTISRLKSKGILIRDAAGPVRYLLSEAVLDVFHADDRRIFAPERSLPSDPWSLVVFSVPEAERARRYELRTELISLGFGFVASGVAIAPSTVLDQAMDRLGERGLDQFVEYFSGDYLKDGDMRTRVAAWWDLELLDSQYTGFLADYLYLAEAQRRGDLRVGPEEAFAVYVEMLTRWRKFPYRDPNLPLDYLPRDWKAPRAKHVFLDLHAALSQPAEEFAAGLLAEDLADAKDAIQAAASAHAVDAGSITSR